MLTITAPFDKNVLNVILITVIIIFLRLHVKYQPYIYKENNQIETLLLIFLIIIILCVQITPLSNNYPLSIAIIITSMIIIPCIIFIYFTIKLFYIRYQRKKQKNLHKINNLGSITSASSNDFEGNTTNIELIPTTSDIVTPNVSTPNKRIP